MSKTYALSAQAVLLALATFVQAADGPPAKRDTVDEAELEKVFAADPGELAAQKNLAGLLALAPNTPLVKQTFEFDEQVFTIDVPKEAKFVPGLLEPTYEWKGIKLHFKAGPNLGELRDRLWRSNHDRKILDSPDTLMVTGQYRNLEKRVHRTRFATQITTVYLTLTFWLQAGNLDQDGIENDDALLLLKCARSVRRKDPLPPDPVAALEALGVKVDREDAKRLRSAKLSAIHYPAVFELLKRVPQVSELNLGFSGMRPEQMRLVAEMPKLERLVCSSWLEDEYLSPLAKSRTLRAVFIESTPLTVGSLPYLVKIPELRELTLKQCELEGDGLDRLADFPKLEVLSLVDSEITSRAFPALARLKTLKALDLEGTCVGDEDLKHFYPMRTLRTLNLKETKVTDAGLKELRRRMPKLEIGT